MSEDTTANDVTTSAKTPKKYPRQGMKIDVNSHGIRRETSLIPKPNKKTGRKKV